MSDARHPEVIAKEPLDLLRELAGADLTDLSEGEVQEVAVLTTDVAKLATAVQVVAAGRVDVCQAWVAEGARSASTWLAWRGHLPTPTSGAVLRCARQLRSLPGAEVAFLAGRITIDHVRLLAAAQRVAPEAYAEDEHRLVELAGDLLFSRFEVLIRYWRQHHDPDGAERDAASRLAARRLHCSSTFDGMVVLDALLDPLTGAIVARELERLERELFEADWADARDRLGDAAAVADLARTPAQRRADALRVMAERSAAKPAAATEPRVLLHVLAGTDAVERMCELRRHRRHPRRSAPCPEVGRRRAHRLRHALQGDRRRCAPTPLQRRHPDRRRDPRPVLPAPVVRRGRRALRHRSHPALRGRWAHDPGQRPLLLPLPPPLAAPTNPAGSVTR